MCPAARYDAIYLSPHLDDGALSCGGQIHRRVATGEKVLVVTVFTGDVPPDSVSELSRKILFYMGLGAHEAMAARRREDRQACRELGAELEHWELPECVYRRSAATGELLYCSMKQLFAEPSPEEDHVLDWLAERLRSLPPAGSLFAPLAVGRHVDHLLVRRAAQRVFEGALGYYEDYPYVQKFRALGKALKKKSSWRREVVELGPADLAAKVRAISAYPSQVRPIFDSDKRMERAVRRYCRRVGGERLWYPAQRG